MAETVQLQVKQGQATRRLTDAEIKLEQVRSEYEGGKATLDELEAAERAFDRAKKALGDIQAQIAEGVVGDYIKERNAAADAVWSPLRPRQ